MKSLLAKTLTSTALVLATFTAAHAFSDNKGPWPISTEEARLLPSMIQYLDQRAARGATTSAASDNPFPLREEEKYWQSPAQIRYFEQREALVAKELKTQPSKSGHMSVTRSE